MNNGRATFGRQGWAELLFPALTALFGLQSLRALFPLLLFVLRERFGWNTLLIGLFALALFLTAFLAAIGWHRLGPDRITVITAGGLGLARLGLQLWNGDPVGELFLATVATTLFLLFLPTYLGRTRMLPGGTVTFAFALLLAFLLDTALLGAATTYAWSWQPDFSLLILVLLLVTLQWVALRWLPSSGAELGDLPWRSAIGWVGIGPALFLQLVFFTNSAALATLSHWRLSAAYGWLLIAHVLGIAASALLWRRGAAPRPWILLATLALFIFTLFGAPQALWAAILFLGGQIGFAVLFFLLLASLDVQPALPGLRHITTADGVGMIFFSIFTFLYYAGYDIALPLSNQVLPPLAAALLGITALAIAQPRPAAAQARRTPAFQALLLSLLLLLLPLYSLVATRRPLAGGGNGLPVRIMTYNLHNGFDITGYLGLEELAAVISAQNPDIVAMQEVSRGWLINGSADTLSWLSNRLDLPYVFYSTTGPLWGLGILSRLPVLATDSARLPPPGLLLQRGYLRARYDLGDSTTLDVINTHFHHVSGESDIRVIQSNALLDLWQGAPRTVFLGDFNAIPTDPEMRLLADAGLRDAVFLGGLEPGYTNPAGAPYQQLDYLWLAPDLDARDVVIVNTTASDHFPVVATIVGEK